MATQRFKTATDITGDLKSVTVIVKDKQPIELHIATSDGLFVVAKGESYGEALRIRQEDFPVKKPAWVAEVKYKDGSVKRKLFHEAEAVAQADEFIRDAKESEGRDIESTSVKATIVTMDVDKPDEVDEEIPF